MQRFSALELKELILADQACLFGESAAIARTLLLGCVVQTSMAKNDKAASLLSRLSKRLFKGIDI